MATQIHKPKVYGNFKKSRTEGAVKPHKNSERYKDRPGMSPQHLDLIRKMPCCVTLAMPGGEAHHLKQGTGERGMQQRSTDKWAVPMAHNPHMEVENAGTRNESAWFAAHGIADVNLLARDLWAATGDLPKMIKILMAHRGHK